MVDDPKPRPDQGFPKMPDPNNMRPMFTNPRPADKNQPRNSAPIQEWEAVLIGKKLVKEGAKDDGNLSQLLYRFVGAENKYLF